MRAGENDTDIPEDYAALLEHLGLIVVVDLELAVQNLVFVTRDGALGVTC